MFRIGYFHSTLPYIKLINHKANFEALIQNKELKRDQMFNFSKVLELENLF